MWKFVFGTLGKAVYEVGSPIGKEGLTPSNVANICNAYHAAGGHYRQLDEIMNGNYDYEPGLPPCLQMPPSSPSPLIIDLNRNGVIEATGLSDGVYFDHDGNHFAEKTSWVGSGDALLVRDINGNGQIDDGSELFGSNTLLSNGQNAANGFQSLAELDFTSMMNSGRNFDYGWTATAMG